MTTRSTMRRRAFLRLSAVAAGGAVLAGCTSTEGPTRNQSSAGAAANAKGSVVRPLRVASPRGEAPTLKRLVEAGELPPLARRLPEHPYVVPHRWLSPGKYGGNLLMNTTSTEEGSHKEFMYGHSPLRWLNDGLDIGPGLVESWESNEDASEWTLHFRQGLKWSDGEPWTTADIMYWWDDLVLNEVHPEVPPDDMRSGRDTVAKVTAPDEYTLVLSFDAPAPVTPERLASWVKRGNGAAWMQPKHYLKQFHPTYNSSIKSDGWYQEHDNKSEWTTNADCPTMTGWRLRSYHEGRSLTFERNPFYWCVDRQGNQLPYIDTITLTAVQDLEVNRLQIEQGQVDYVHGPFSGLELSDVAGLKRVENLDVLLWDSGSGTMAMVMLNLDYRDDAIRNLIKKPEFRQALSHAYNRQEARKAIYFNTGELTTGTTHPNAVEFEVNDRGKEVYRHWRDSYVAYDPAKAKSLLDELGVVDVNGDGLREFPDGTKLTLRLDYPGDARSTSDFMKMNNQLRQNWAAVGIDAELNPVAPAGYWDQWFRGQLMSHTAWSVTDTPMTYPAPVVPVPPAHWAPLHAQGFALKTADPGLLEEQADRDPWDRQPAWLLPEEGSPIDRLWKLYNQGRAEPDRMKLMQVLWDIYKVHIEEGPFFIGTVAKGLRVMVIHKELQNVPRKENLALGGWVDAWTHPTPAVYDPEAYFWANPEEHQLTD
jgi:ABC-type transport system substrate-binding protein